MSARPSYPMAQKDYIKFNPYCKKNQASVVGIKSRTEIVFITVRDVFYTIEVDLRCPNK
jgi:hypothetical protein